jgi:putative molybdopterin biosynthesis protein
MGIYSAAKAFGLEFMPICEEEYDFIIPAKFMELELVKDFIEILNSERFMDVLEKMGGYRM